MPFPRPLSAALVVALGVLQAGCATAGSTFGSGVGDRLLEDPPYYAGARATPAGVAGTETGVLPVYFQPGDGGASIFAPTWAQDSQVAALLADMNAYLDSLTTGAGTRTVRLVEGGRMSAVAPTTLGVPPDVQFGCTTVMDLPDEECDVPGGALGRGGQYMKLAVGRPSAEWVAWASEAMDGAGVSHALVITLELGQYMLRQRGLLGHKYVELGTNHRADIPWLTSLETPLDVMQLTGALVDLEGRAVRIGAEGMMAKRTRLAISALRAQEIWRDEDVAELRHARRDDLPGRPLVWQEAMRALVAQLTR
jgi:hypothetical protein